MRSTTLAKTPEAMQLRYLSTLYDIADDNNSTIVFPFPTDMVKNLVERLGDGGSGKA